MPRLTCTADLAVGKVSTLPNYDDVSVAGIGRGPCFTPIDPAAMAQHTDRDQPPGILDFASSAGYAAPFNLAGMKNLRVSMKLWIPAGQGDCYMVAFGEQTWFRLVGGGEFETMVGFQDGGWQHSAKRWSAKVRPNIDPPPGTGGHYVPETWYDLVWGYGGSNDAHYMTVDGLPSICTSNALDGSPAGLGGSGQVYLGTNPHKSGVPFTGKMGPNITVEAW